MKLFLNAKLMMLFFGALIIQSNKENYSLFSGCNNSSKASDKTTSLKKSFKQDFLIGTAFNTPQIEEKDLLAAALIPEQFNAATPENIMNAEIIHPGWNQYNFEFADKLVEYGKKHDIKN